MAAIEVYEDVINGLYRIARKCERYGLSSWGNDIETLVERIEAEKQCLKYEEDSNGR